MSVNPTLTQANGRTDPTANVKDMLWVAVAHQNELRMAETRRVDDLRAAEKHRVNEKFDAAKEALGIALVAQEKSTAQALDGTKEAIIKNDANTDKRFDLLSEKIDSIAETMSKNTGAQGIYVTHSDLSAEMEKLRLSFEGMLRPVITFMNSQQGGAKSTNMVWVYITIGIGALGGIFALILNALRLAKVGL